MPDHNYCVYIMTNWRNRVLYIGMTNNLLCRVGQHKQGTGSKFANRFNLTKLVYYEHTTEVEAAIRREKELKGWRRERKNDLIASMNPEWRDMAEEL